MPGAWRSLSASTLQHQLAYLPAKAVKGTMERHSDSHAHSLRSPHAPAIASPMQPCSPCQLPARRRPVAPCARR